MAQNVCPLNVLAWLDLVFHSVNINCLFSTLKQCAAYKLFIPNPHTSPYIQYVLMASFIFYFRTSLSSTHSLLSFCIICSSCLSASETHSPGLAGNSVWNAEVSLEGNGLKK